MKITIVGLGYVGMSLSVLLGQFHEVIALDIDEEKIEKVNKKISPIKDDDIGDKLRNVRSKVFTRALSDLD
tara:strand:+ start:134 stop:346 length:213 start_codon:yes stop_codon:yes gene_type:complete